MAIVFQKNKKTGVTYVYESKAFWDKEKQHSRATRKCIGKLDPETGEIIPNRKKAADKPVKRGSVPIVDTARSFYGATYLFDTIGENLGVTADLKKCFPDTWKQILSTAYYLILEDKNPLSRLPRWASTHKHPFGKTISSQRSSELFASITEKDREQFFRLQERRRVENEYWVYDTTSISSYSKCLKQVRYGINKDHERLPQINLAMLFGEKSNLPFYYRKLPGNISDVKTIHNLLADMQFLGYDKIKLVMDRGFYSQANINDLYKCHLKFLLATKVSLRLVQNELEKQRESLRDWTNYSQKYDLFATTVPISWDYSQERPYKGDVLKSQRRMYLHLYFNSEQALEAEKKLSSLLCLLQSELESGKLNQDHLKQYEKYFETRTTPVRGTKVFAKQEAINEAKKNYGYFAMISNEVKNPIEALQIYRNKDLVEKAFGNLKERLSFNRLAVSSEQSLDGKMFVEFIALIYLSWVKKKMQDKDLFRKYTMQEFFDELDVIECFEQPGKAIRISEITKKQAELYETIGIEAPKSLQ